MARNEFRRPAWMKEVVLKPRVMIVEDDEAIVVLLTYNIEAEGFEVEAVTRGDEADLRLKERVPPQTS